VDIFVDKFHMCHELDLRSRLDIDPDTLPPADLLLTKLQIVEINRKDLTDAIGLLYQHEPANERGADAIDLGRLVEVTSGDWGWYTTFGDNLARLPELAQEILDEVSAAHIASRVAAIQEAIEAAPKSLKWRARAKVGRRMAWYELPEEKRQ
jgi:hypothetical protein